MKSDVIGLPWVVRKKDEQVRNAAGEMVCLRGFALSGNDHSGAPEAVRDFIVRACNSHTELLEALEALLEAVHGVPCGPEDQCRAAIAKAKGGAS